MLGTELFVDFLGTLVNELLEQIDNSDDLNQFLVAGGLAIAIQFKRQRQKIENV